MTTLQHNTTTAAKASGDVRELTDQEQWAEFERLSHFAYERVVRAQVGVKAVTA